MNKDQPLSDEEQKIMLQYGITCQNKSVYLYRGHRYDQLSDAVRYARDGLDRVSSKASTSPN